MNQNLNWNPFRSNFVRCGYYGTLWRQHFRLVNKVDEEFESHALGYRLSEIVNLFSIVAKVFFLRRTNECRSHTPVGRISRIWYLGGRMPRFLPFSHESNIGLETKFQLPQQSANSKVFLLATNNQNKSDLIIDSIRLSGYKLIWYTQNRTREQR